MDKADKDKIGAWEVVDNLFVEGFDKEEIELMVGVEGLPVEEVILQYDNRDGYFLKAMPLHHTQRVLVDDGKVFKISVHVKITNDFVMALLSRSRSLEVIAPMHLRKRMMDVYREALVRNSVPNDMFNNNNVESNK